MFPSQFHKNAYGFRDGAGFSLFKLKKDKGVYLVKKNPAQDELDFIDQLSEPS
ncbi:hypothetical protein L1D32_01975 [Shewanella insulae]|uniref:hypothetical protein n=1 Tax=Shewanella insulae TaxID=2681496 RepID=UPI001EFE5194|nr:hypothetical protein [Shewanella insulae]MCG9736928.1 hypothetical protein [Shewanella insulae]